MEEESLSAFLNARNGKCRPIFKVFLSPRDSAVICNCNEVVISSQQSRHALKVERVGLYTHLCIIDDTFGYSQQQSGVSRDPYYRRRTWMMMMTSSITSSSVRCRICHQSRDCVSHALLRA